ncbi:MAG: exosortase E/protease, VPEID-CTERM system [Pirellulaceae bacterium]|nr:exosortase E/protease, VPEID-CTERM system [Pirellulaceae bacterium]
MSGLVEQGEVRKRASSFPLIWVGMSLLALLELLIVSARFDSGVLVDGQGAVRFLADRLPLVPQFIAVSCAATLVFGGRELVDCLGKASRHTVGHSVPLFLTTHLFVFALFFAASIYYFEVDHGASAIGFVIWGLLAFATAMTWLAVLLNPLVWLAVAKEISVPVLIGSSVGALAWFAGQWATSVWDLLAFATFQQVWFMLTVLCVDVIQDTSVFMIGTADFAVRIAPECSGYEGMGLAVVFMTTYLWWKRNEHIFPRSLLLVPLSIALMFVVNGVRIAALILIGHFGAQEIALGGFHSQAGWIGFNVVALGMVAFARTCPWFCKSEVRQEIVQVGADDENRAVPMLAPFVFLTLTIVLLGAVQTGFDWLYPIRFLVVVTAIGLCFTRYPTEHWKFCFRWTPLAIGMAVYLVWNLLETGDAGVAKSLYESTRSLSPAMFMVWLVFRVLGSVITVPLAEEFAFRGYLIPWLAGKQSRRWSWVALVVSSVAFGMLHPGRWLAGTIAGLLYGIAYYRKGSVMDAVLAHATTNALIAAEAILLSRWYLWG